MSAPASTWPEPSRLPGPPDGWTRKREVLLECLALDEDKRPDLADAALGALGEIYRLQRTFARVNRLLDDTLAEDPLCSCGWSAPCECGDGSGVANPVISIAAVREVLDGIACSTPDAATPARPLPAEPGTLAEALQLLRPLGDDTTALDDAAGLGDVSDTVDTCVCRSGDGEHHYDPSVCREHLRPDTGHGWDRHCGGPDCDGHGEVSW